MVRRYAVDKASARGKFFSKPGDKVYENQIVGVHASAGDLKVNICKAKQLNNMRSTGNDEMIKLAPAMQLTLEDAVEYVASDEYVEVTPTAVRMGKYEKSSAKGRGK